MKGSETMTSISHINDRLYVGGDPDYSTDVAQDVLLLNAQVDLIIDCRSQGEARWGGWIDQEGLDVPILHIPMHDDLKNNNKPEDFLSALERVHEEYPNAQSFFVHCHMGVNRGPSMAMFFLMQLFEMTAKEAFMELREKRPVVGLAYAEDAVAASLILANGQISADINRWTQFEDNYWTPEHIAGVQNHIKRNHYGPNHRIVTDEKGIDHVMAPEVAF